MTNSSPGPAADLIEHAAGIIVAKKREPHTAPYHWAAALWEAGMLQAPGPLEVDDPAAPESSSPLDLEAIRARYDDYCERSLNEDDVFDAAMQCADDVSALLAALEEAQRERDELRQHSITLNTICYQIGEALGLATGGLPFTGNPIELVADLIASRSELLVELRAATGREAAARADVERMREERDAYRDKWALCDEAYQWMRPVVEAAKVWQVARADQQGSGMTFHRRCSALAGALDTYESQESTE